jgi:hypothetical protein
MNTHGKRGFAAVDYLAIIAVIGIVFAGLVALRPTRVGPETPVDVIPPIIRLLGRPVDNLTPRPTRPARPSHPRPPRPGSPRPPRPNREPSTIPLPEWWSRP